MTRPPIPRLTTADVEEITGKPLTEMAHQCHDVSLSIVRSRRIPGARVARGFCKRVSGQHSWVTVGDPYALGAPIIDPTLWSYDPAVTGVWHGRLNPHGRHVPHGGHGTLFTHPMPIHHGGPTIELTSLVPLSAWAQSFLQAVGPLDRRGWHSLAILPVRGWPAGEIIAAMDDTPELRALVPIDRLGMPTDRNPGGLYLPASEEANHQ